MNGPDLLKELTAVLKESGWLDKATEYMREHPERFSLADFGGLISNVTLSVSYQPKSLQDVQSVAPILFATVGNTDSIMNGYNKYDTGGTRVYTWIVGEKVTEVYNAGSRDTGTQSC